MTDKFRDFAHLSAEKKEGRHYDIQFRKGSTGLLILASHGGKIESDTSEIATALAREDDALYCFEGVQPANNFDDLHITSTHFDEPRCLEALAKAEQVIAVHGYGDDESSFVIVGGLDRDLAAGIERSLKNADFIIRDDPKVAGTSPSNVCNRGKTGAGCQLEISRKLRSELTEDPERMKAFVGGIRAALEDHGATQTDRGASELSWEWKIVASLCMFLGALAVLGGLFNSLLNVVGGAAYFAAGLAVLRIDRLRPRVAKVVGWAAAVVALLTVLSLVRGLAAGMVSVPEAALILIVLTVPISCAHYLIRRNAQSSHPTGK